MKRCAPILSCILLICIAVAPAAAMARAKGSVAGTVVTPEGRALIGAVVALFKHDDRGQAVSLARSDQHGIYSLNNITPGSYVMQISRTGYQVLNAPRVTIDSGKTTTVNVMLQELLNFISVRNDPRNWDLKTVMRSTSDRRLIFRDLPGAAGGDDQGDLFHRSGTLNVASSALLSGDNYAVYPNLGDSGIVSNFAFTEPISQHGRMIFSGQLTSGYDSLWRVRNTFHYRSDPGRDWKLSVGYGRLNLNRPSAAAIARPAQFFNQDPMLRDSGVETLAMGFEASNEFLDIFALEYGLDLSRINYGTTQNIWSPYFQIMITPHQGWLFRAAMTSRRNSAKNSVELPEGDVINLMEPTAISKINGQVFFSQVRHAELSVAKKLVEETSLEVTFYRDRTNGPGTPFLITAHTKRGKISRAAQLRSDQDCQQGFRVALARMLLDTMRGSITYSYGSATNLSNPDASLSGDYVTAHLLDMMQQSYYHSFTSQLEANIPQTRTQVLAAVRWYPGNPISPIDLFADRLDTFTKGMSFSLRQAIPVPDFMGYAGRWEALIDVRNPFDQGRYHSLTSDGDIILTRNPRTLRFGLNLNFY
jgi:hypothetical protein